MFRKWKKLLNKGFDEKLLEPFSGSENKKYSENFKDHQK